MTEYKIVKMDEQIKNAIFTISLKNRIYQFCCKSKEEAEKIYKEKLKQLAD